MARQKSTDRAEARRRHRSELSPSEAELAEQEAAAAAVGGAAGARSSRPRPGTGPDVPSGRIGVVEAFRLAARPADIRGDLLAFPSIATGTKAVWAPTVICLVAGGLFLVEDLRQNPIVNMLVLVALYPPPAMIPPFLAGMLTRRGSWLAGLVVGFASSLIWVVVATAGGVVSDGGSDVVTAAIANLGLGLLFGGFVGAFAGFYRRFLAFSSPPRDRRRGQQSKRSARARR